MNDIERGNMAMKAEYYLRLIVKEMREEVIEVLSRENPDLESIRINIAACNLIESNINRDISRGTDAKKQMENSRE